MSGQGREAMARTRKLLRAGAIVCGHNLGAQTLPSMAHRPRLGRRSDRVQATLCVLRISDEPLPTLCKVIMRLRCESKGASRKRGCSCVKVAGLRPALMLATRSAASVGSPRMLQWGAAAVGETRRVLLQSEAAVRRRGGAVPLGLSLRLVLKV